MKVSSASSMVLGAMIGASAATAMGMMSRQTQRKLKKAMWNTGKKMADGFGNMLG